MLMYRGSQVPTENRRNLTCDNDDDCDIWGTDAYCIGVLAEYSEVKLQCLAMWDHVVTAFLPLHPVHCVQLKYLHLYVSIFSFVLYCIFLQLLYTLSILRLTPWQVCSRYIHTRDQHHAPWLRSPRPGEVTNMTSNIHHHAMWLLFSSNATCRCCSHHPRLTIMLS